VETNRKSCGISNGSNTSDPEGHFCCLRPFCHTLEIIAAVILLLKLKDIPRSQAVTYTVKVVMSQKWWKIETLVLLLQTVIGRVPPTVIRGLMNSGNSVTLTVKVIHVLQAFSNEIFRTGVQQLTKFQVVYPVTRSLCNS